MEAMTSQANVQPLDSTTLHGRRVIYSDETAVTEKNVIDILSRALPIHAKNSAEIQFLYNYYKGVQPIIGKTKQYRDEINNKVIVNRANEIVSFKTGYLMGQPVQYIYRGGNDKTLSKYIEMLNDYVFQQDKAAKDKELADWFHICGTAFRMIKDNSENEGSPFNIYTLNPINTFVVYSSAVGHRPLMGVNYVEKLDGNTVYAVYTENTYYELFAPTGLSPIKEDITLRRESTKSYIPKGVPIIEYPANSARLGAFEIVLTMLNAINTVTSNRIDGIEQFVDAILVLTGVDMSDEEIAKIKQDLGLTLPQGADAKYLIQELNQTQTQTLVDDMYSTVLTICGMPNRNGGSSTSDTGAAVIMRDGWSAAEARALDTERMFDISEKHFLRLALEIMNTRRETTLRLENIDIRFTRRNYENIQAKVQSLTTMLSSDKIHPRLAFEYCGMFVDPELAFRISEEYETEKKQATKNELVGLMNEETLKAKANITAEE